MDAQRLIVMDEGLPQPADPAAAIEAAAGSSGAAENLDEVVDELNAIVTAKRLETAKAVGEFVLRRFYCGDIRAFRAKWHPGHMSLRQLAKHPRLQVSASFISQALGILDQIQVLPDEVAGSLTFSHQRLLLAVQDVEAKKNLAIATAREHLTCRELEARVAAALAVSDQTPHGRPRLPAFAQTPKLLRGVVDSLNPSTLTRQEFSRFSWSRSVQVLDEALQVVDEVRSRLIEARNAASEMVAKDLEEEDS